MSERTPWRVGIVGCGSIGRMHLRALHATARARVVVVSSRQEERARAVATEEGCDYTTDPGALVTRPDVDLVSITSSSGSHAGIALAALAAGKHLVIEKPMAMTTADCRAILEAAAARGRVVSVISQRRFEATHQIVKRLLGEGALGRLLLLEASCPYFRTQEYYDSADWRGTIAEDGGALMNQAIHSVDLMLWLGGPAREVFGRTATQTHRMEAEDLALATVSFTSGALGTIMASTSIRPGFLPSMALYGEKGTIKLEGAQVVHWTVPDVAPPGEAAAGAASAGVASPQIASHEHHQAQLAELLDALEQGRPPAVTGEDGLRAVELVEGVYRSSASNRPVLLGQV
jgi:UDP-N-acetyl-2-amino-2-deoxyglucuronate dehydrogenase